MSSGALFEEETFSKKKKIFPLGFSSARPIARLVWAQTSTMRSALKTIASPTGGRASESPEMTATSRRTTTPSKSSTKTAAVIVDLERRQGSNKQQLELLSRPSRRAEVILGAASLLPIDDDSGFGVAAASSSSSSKPAPPPPRRRSLLAAAFLLPPLSAAASAASLLLTAAPPPAAEAAEEENSEIYSSPKGFSLTPPKGWLLKSKPGADVLFASPLNSRATIGISTAPVRLDALADFGTVTEVADRLLGAELAKDGCLAATLRLSSGGEVPAEWRRSLSSNPSSSPSSPSSSSSLYYFEYELLTTRAHKVVVVAVGVAGRTLFIFNGFAPCAKGKGKDGADTCPPLSSQGDESSGDDAPSATLDEIRRSVSTFAIS